MHALSTIDVLVILAYFILIVAVGLYRSYRVKETASDYFLAGRQMGWVAIGLSLFATNIGTEHFVGLAGYGASRGMAVGNIEWLAIVFLMILGWFLAPIFLKANLYTIPEFFGKRFNDSSRLYMAGMSIIAYVLTKLSITLFAGGLLLEHVLGWDIYTSAIIIMVITGLYTIIGGLSAVIYTSAIQAVFLIGGSLLLTWFGLNEVGGWSGLQERLPAEHFSVFKAASDPDFPWTGIVFGAPILAIWYWCTDQYIVQRILSAKDINAARNGTLLAGFLKILPVFLWVVPGLIAMALYPGISGDEAYPALLSSSLLPIGVKGLVLAGVLAALMSSLAACFNSTATLFTMDFYRYFRPDASDRKLVLIGRLSTTGLVLTGILWIPLTKFISSQIYVYLQGLQSLIAPPIAAVFIAGIFWKKATGRAAISTLILGGLVGAIRFLFTMYPPSVLQNFPLIQFFVDMNFLHFAVLLFLFSMVTVVAVSLYDRSEVRTDIKNLTLSKLILTTDSTEQSRSILGLPSNWIASAALFIVLAGLWTLFI